MPFGRRTTGPRAADSDALRARVGPGERILAASWTTAGEAVGGTTVALYLPDDVVPWHEIDQAVWDQDESRLDVASLAVDGPARTYQVFLTDPGRLPELVRERVTASIVVNRHVPLSGRLGVKIIGRRLPGSDELDWVVVYDPGIDADAPGTRADVQDALVELRTELGV